MVDRIHTRLYGEAKYVFPRMHLAVRFSVVAFQVCQIGTKFREMRAFTLPGEGFAFNLLLMIYVKANGLDVEKSYADCRTDVVDPALHRVEIFMQAHFNDFMNICIFQVCLDAP